MLGTGGRACAARAIAWGVALAALVAPHASQGDASDPQAGEIFRALHLELELKDISQAASASLDASARSLPPGDRLLLRWAVSAGFDPGALRTRALGAFSARLDAEHAGAALAWLARPEIQALLTRAATGQSPGCADSSADPDTGDGLQRDALLRRFDRSSSRAARSRKDAALVLAAMLRVANRLLPPSQRYLEREITRLLASQRGRLVAVSPGASRLRQRYRGIPTREVERALAFLESPSGTWLQRELDIALERALVTAAEATAAHLVSSFGSAAAPVPLRMARASAP